MHLRRPSEEAIRALLEDSSLRFTYDEVGLSARLASDPTLLDRARYDFDRNVFSIGHGPEVFEKACAALLRWAHFDVPWLSFYKGGSDPEALAHEGQVVATLLSYLGFWFLNPCRVVYFERDAQHLAFAYGTLPGHAESGEERFEIRLDPNSDEVEYRLEAFSRPAHLASRLAYPLARRLQDRFAKASGASLAAASIRDTVA